MKTIICSLLLAISVSACGGGGDALTAQQLATTPTCPRYVSLTAQRAKLSHWFSGGVSGKRIVWVGDSTTEKMGPASQFGWAGVNDAYLNKFVNSAGLALYGTTQIWLGSNGNTLQNFVNDTPTNTGINAAIAASGDLLILSYGINDVRIGGASQTSIVANLKSAVNAIRAALPNSDVILRMPNSLLSTDVNSHNWVVPNSSAQTYTDILRDAYRGLVNEWPNVVVYDSQALLFTEISQPSSIYMTDQLHPNADGYLKVFDQLAEIAGVAAPTCP